MNRAEVMAKWDAMTPRERDAWVAEKVMGECRHEWGEFPEGTWCSEPNARYCNKCKVIYTGTYGFPVVGAWLHYSEKIEAAFEVVEKVHSMLFSVRRKFLDELQKIISIEKLTGLDRHIAWPDVFWYITPEKICKAALLAVGVEHGQE